MTAKNFGRRWGSLAAVAALALAACSGGEKAATSSESAGPAEGSNRGQAFIKNDKSQPNILQIALNSPDHTTLVAAVQAAELENVLVNAGPLTVFAPTNEAFEALPPGTLDELLKPENKQKLANIVTSHAAPGKFTLDQLKDGMDLYLATGQYVKVEVKEDGTYVNGAKILAEVPASNGIVYVVDKVFLVEA
ncbi:MAG: fasciclin domain-containing protein [Gemmatimonadota bacterium]